MGLLVSVR